MVVLFGPESVDIYSAAPSEPEPQSDQGTADVQLVEHLVILKLPKQIPICSNHIHHLADPVSETRHDLPGKGAFTGAHVRVVRNIPILVQAHIAPDANNAVPYIS